MTDRRLSNKEVLNYIKNDARKIEIPHSLEPEQMKLRLEQTECIRKKRSIHKYQKALVAAACFCIVIGGSAAAWQYGQMADQTKTEALPAEESFAESDAKEEVSYPEITYEDIYASMLPAWEEASDIYFRNVSAMPTEDAVIEEAAEESVFNLSSKKMEASDTAYGNTNVQTVGVDEGDIVKNDGRYLYQLVDIVEENEYRQGIQIVDTKDELKIRTCIDDFESISEFYVWEDMLVVIENKYRDEFLEDTSASQKLAVCGVERFERYYHEITFYHIEDRGIPLKVKTFTLQGRYMSSRVADGYFYGFSRFYADQGEGEKDYDAYIPVVDGERIQADRIYLPEESSGTSYLVLVAIDLKNPMEFTETTAIVSAGEQYYVSSDHIYATSHQWMEEKAGWSNDTTSILKFSYGNGTFSYQAKGELPGNLDDSFSMDEYEGNLRAVTTVQEWRREKLTDDRTGEMIGYHILDERQTNALYVLDRDLNMIGKIEGLAENEQIYSARFMGDVGYFVTFRQTDPLFAVDLSDPKKPTILSELKVSGFSDYLHIYGENRLLGIGMEADEEAGQQKGMKLSMFDISDPGDIKEISRLHLEKYNYSEALHNHKAVLISPGENLFGFEAEGSNRGQYWRKYLVYSYDWENDRFEQEFSLDAKNEDGGYMSVRGTFIEDTFYLLGRDGSVRSYDRETGEQRESLER